MVAVGVVVGVAVVVAVAVAVVVALYCTQEYPMKFELRLCIEVPDELGLEISMNQSEAATEFQQFVNESVGLAVEAWGARRLQSHAIHLVANEEGTGFVEAPTDTPPTVH